MSTDILTDAKANWRVNAAIKISRIIAEVRAMERKDSFRRRTISLMFRWMSPGIIGRAIWTSSSLALAAPGSPGNRRRTPAAKLMSNIPEFPTRARKNAPVTPAAAASVGVANPK